MSQPAFPSSAIRSLPGSRGFVFIKPSFPLFTNQPEEAFSFRAGHNTPQGSFIYRPWNTAEGFDYLFENDPIPSNLKLALPCDNFKFDLSTEDSYKTTGMGASGSGRVRSTRCGGYKFTLDFPVIITDNQKIVGAGSVYAVIDAFLKNLFNTIKIGSSTVVTNNEALLLPGVLESFTISANGINGAQPIKCSMVVKGIIGNRLKRQLGGQYQNLFKAVGSNDERWEGEESAMYPSRDISDLLNEMEQLEDSDNANPLKGGGRYATIQDCEISFNDVDLQQVVAMDLSITQSCRLKSTALAANKGGGIIDPELEFPTGILHANHLYIDQRIVNGSFTFLESSRNSVNGINGLPWTDRPKSKVGGVLAPSPGQWASPIHIKFGGQPLAFNFPISAAFWQPQSQQLSTGSTLTTVKFLARADVSGQTEFDTPSPYTKYVYS